MLFLAPVIAITVFWLVHILPEKIAEKRHHPQAAAIKTLCLLSLFFGGLLWPLAWLWAYSKPVLYKMAYGVDAVKPEHEERMRPCPRCSEPAGTRADEGEVADEEHEVGTAAPTSSRAPRAATAQATYVGDLNMELLLLGIYSFIVWLIFFKYKLLPWNTCQPGHRRSRCRSSASQR